MLLDNASAGAFELEPVVKNVSPVHIYRMSKTKALIFAAAVTASAMFVGCASIPPGAERGPNGTMAFDVLVEASAPGASIEANGQVVGQTPCHIKIFGDPDGTFHDFGSYYYSIRAMPLASNQFAQARWFRTGHLMSGEDMVPSRIYFDMSHPAPPEAPPPPVGYYGPTPYPYPYYYPGVRVYVGPRWRHW